MAGQTACPKCGARYALPVGPTAKRLRCKKCGTVFVAKPEPAAGPQPALGPKQQDTSASDVATLPAPKRPPETRGSREPSSEDSTLIPVQVESLWSATLTQDLTPCMTIKTRPHTQPKPSRLSVRERSLAEPGQHEAGADYDLLEVLGKGGMGVVYAARQASVDRRIALKMLLPKMAESADAQAKFLAEAAVTGDLEHPNIVPLYDLGSDEGGKLFYAMKLVKGTPWSKVLAEKPLRENLGILQRVGDAVAFAHSRGVIHRDLKPQNVMLGEYGEVLVMDWGLAVSVTAEGKAEQLTKETACGGTPAYLPPEVALGKVEQIGPGSDVYLLGAILYEILTGKPPHHAPTAMACLLAAAQSKIQPTEVKGELLDIALKAMATEPEGRHESVKEFQAALQEYQAHSESIALSTLAQEGLERAAETKDYADFARAMFSFEEALKLWNGNKAALTGAKTARVSYATCAFEKGDLDLAGSLLETEGLKKTPLAGKVEAARGERGARARRLKVLTYASAGLAAAVLIVVTVAFFLVRAEQAATAVQRDKAVGAQVAEAEQRRKAEENERKALAAAEAEKKAKETAQAREAETAAVLGFVQDKVFAAARPEGQEGGLGREVTLRKAIEAAMPYVEASFAKQPLIEAQLRWTLGTSFLHLGEAGVGAEQFERVRAIYTQHLGPDDPKTLRSMVWLANSYQDLGRLADALRLRQETLALQKARLGPDSLDTLASMANLATSYDTAGQQAEALKMREELLALQRAKLSPDHTLVLAAMYNLAVSYSERGRYAEALKLREETLALYKAKFGPDHPETLMPRTCLAKTYSDLGRYADALKLEEEALALQKAKLGPDHPDTLVTMNNLAGSYNKLGRRGDALRLNEEILAVRKVKLGPYHPHTLVSMNNLASSYSKLNRHTEALKLFEETLALMRAKLGPDYPCAFNSMAGIAKSLMDLDRGAEAVPIIDECLRRAAGKDVFPGLIAGVMDLRLRHFKKTKDAAGCRATAEMWESLNRTDDGSLYNAARMRAITVGIIRAADKSPDGAKQADAEADKAMAWLKQAVAAGYKDAAHIAKDKDLDVLRDREDFRKLMAELEVGKETKPPGVSDPAKGER